MFLDFIDEIYVVNLVQREDRRKVISAELNQHNIPFTIFEATYDTNGIRGLVTTMIRLLKQAREKKQRNILVLEDDASFLVSNPVAFLKEIIPQIPTSYHLFYLGVNLIARPIRMSENVLKVTDGYSTHAIMYSHEGIDAVLRNLEEFPEKPYDIFMREQILPQYQSYCSFPMLMTQCFGYSDIEKKDMDWGKLMAISYSMQTKRLPNMSAEKAKCHGGHQIDGIIPSIDEFQFDKIQHPEHIGKICDCGRFVYDEGRCETCGGERWKITWKEKQ
jgi:GR25 family glycosyltransferase involved in LPS biosynthesis